MSTVCKTILCCPNPVDWYSDLSLFLPSYPQAVLRKSKDKSTWSIYGLFRIALLLQRAFTKTDMKWHTENLQKQFLSWSPKVLAGIHSEFSTLLQAPFQTWQFTRTLVDIKYNSAQAEFGQELKLHCLFLQESTFMIASCICQLHADETVGSHTLRGIMVINGKKLELIFIFVTIAWSCAGQHHDKKYQKPRIDWQVFPIETAASCLCQQLANKVLH